MGTFSDILNTLSSLKGDVIDYVSGYHMSSLSRESLRSVFNFPVLVADDISVEDAVLTSKALERQYTTFTLTVLTANPYLNLRQGETPSAYNYINAFHQNIDVKSDSTDLINTVTGFLKECLYDYDINPEVIEENSMVIVSNIFSNVNYKDINLENVKWNYSIGDIVPQEPLGKKVGYNHLLEKVNDPQRIRMSPGNSYGSGGNVIMRIPSNVFGNAVSKSMDSDNGDRTSNKNDEFKFYPTRQLNYLLDNDSKKANELVPTLLYMRVYPIDTKSKQEYPPMDFIIGIKATLHPIPSEEMVINIARGIKNDDNFFNFLRWTTGEISFAKDFILGINELKIDAINTSSKTSRWWTVLKRRKSNARIKNLVLPKKLLPNATIVITKNNADTLKKEFGYDITDSRIAYKLIRNYFLIAFVIVDDALQRVQFLFDGRNEFDTLTYATLAKENTVDDRRFKDMISMLGRRI